MAASAPPRPRLRRGPSPFPRDVTAMSETRPILELKAIDTFYGPVQAHFGLPLAHQSLGRHHEDALHPATLFLFAQHHAGLDGLAETHLIGQQVANAVAAHRAVQRVELVRQRHHAGLDRRQ